MGLWCGFPFLSYDPSVLTLSHLFSVSYSVVIHLEQPHGLRDIFIQSRTTCIRIKFIITIGYGEVRKGGGRGGGIREMINDIKTK